MHQRSSSDFAVSITGVISKSDLLKLLKECSFKGEGGGGPQGSHNGNELECMGDREVERVENLK